MPLFADFFFPSAFLVGSCFHSQTKLACVPEPHGGAMGEVVNWEQLALVEPAG